jgi:flagellar hook-length control protein FliK
VRATEISQQSADRLAEKQHSATASRIAPAAEPHAQGDSRDDSTGTDQANSRQQDVQRLTDGRVQTLPSQGTKTAFAAIISKTEAPAAGTLTGDALRSAVIDQIANAVHTKISEQSSEIRIALKPESLGEVSVRVRMDEGTMRAEINVQNASVKSVLELNLPALRDQLAARGIDLQQIEIVAGTQAQFQDSSAQSHTARQHTGPRRQQVSDAGGERLRMPAGSRHQLRHAFAAQLP